MKAKQVDNLYSSTKNKKVRKSMPKANKKVKKNIQKVNKKTDIKRKSQTKLNNSNTKKGGDNTRLKNKPSSNPKKKISKTKKKLIKWTSIITLLIIALTLFLLSDLFNIKEVQVLNNKKVSSEEIISLSGITTNDNLFKILTVKVKENIKTNAYIEDVKIKKSINGVVKIEIEERQPTYMIPYANSYVYINNQGYMLEISENKLELPIILGTTTPTEQIEAGKRLEIADLKKLDSVIKIMETAKTKQIFNIITSIDITNELDYLIRIESEKKTIHFGDATNINEKALWIMSLLENEKDIEGEIFVKNINKIYFREKV